MTTFKSSSTIRRAASREPLMDIEAVAARLGVTVRNVRRLVGDRRIPFVKWRHLVRFDPIEIEAWLEEARVPAETRDRRMTPDRASWKNG